MSSPFIDDVDTGLATELLLAGRSWTLTILAGTVLTCRRSGHGTDRRFYRLVLLSTR